MKSLLVWNWLFFSCSRFHIVTHQMLSLNYHFLNTCDWFHSPYLASSTPFHSPFIPIYVGFVLFQCSADLLTNLSCPYTCLYLFLNYFQVIINYLMRFLANGCLPSITLSYHLSQYSCHTVMCCHTSNHHSLSITTTSHIAFVSIYLAITSLFSYILCFQI